MEYRVCHFCNRNETVGGAFLDAKNPAYFPHRRIKILKKGDRPPMHAICKILESKGFYLDDTHNLHKVKTKYGEE